MNPYQRMVKHFHVVTDSTVGDKPALRDNELRAKLIMEEAVETCAAMGFWASGAIQNEDLSINWETEKEFKNADFPEVIDGLCDLLYVVFGSAVAFGIDLDTFFNEVHDTNLAKLAGEKRADGKQLKPEGWRPPRIEMLLKEAKMNHYYDSKES